VGSSFARSILTRSVRGIASLDGLLERLNAGGIAVIVKPEWDSPAAGRFARIHDPEGNAIELWEPPSA
jgi:predicted enzyme related to lactoylglutathione lyase